MCGCLMWLCIKNKDNLSNLQWSNRLDTVWFILGYKYNACSKLLHLCCCQMQICARLLHLYGERNFSAFTVLPVYVPYFMDDDSPAAEMLNTQYKLSEISGANSKFSHFLTADMLTNSLTYSFTRLTSIFFFLAFSGKFCELPPAPPTALLHASPLTRSEFDLALNFEHKRR